MRVLIVEDDQKLQSLLRSELSRREFQADVVDAAPDAVAALADDRYDIVLLDIALRKGSGLDVCRAVRARSAVPILILTVTDDLRVKVAALQMGADDYMTKPFHIGELIARMQAILRRTRIAPEDVTASVVTVDGLTVDLQRYAVSRGGSPVTLTKKEFGLLRELVTHPDRVLTYDHLFRAVWGEPAYDDVRPVHVHVSHLRRKIEPPSAPRRIVSIPGVGYRFRLHDAV